VHEGLRLLELSVSGTELTVRSFRGSTRGGYRLESDRFAIRPAYGEPTPVVALNRAIAAAQHEGYERGA
jgi:hypothetical protein